MSEARSKTETSVRSRLAAIVLVAGTTFAGCGDEGYGSSIEVCQQGDNTGISAVVGEGGVNDPLSVLKFAKSKEAYYDNGGANGNFWYGEDPIDQLGEVVCSVRPAKEGKPELVFTPSGAEVRAAYADTIQPAPPK